MYFKVQITPVSYKQLPKITLKWLSGGSNVWKQWQLSTLVCQGRVGISNAAVFRLMSSLKKNVYIYIDLRYLTTNFKTTDKETALLSMFSMVRYWSFWSDKNINSNNNYDNSRIVWEVVINIRNAFYFQFSIMRLLTL